MKTCRQLGKQLLFMILALPWVAVVPAQDPDLGKEERELARYYEKWLNEDVVYLITEEERSVFGNLTTYEEKDRFIEQFWQARDPDLTTAANEAREEHYRRVAFANQYFGSGIPGWKTDRGRIYIMFGEPDQKEYNAGAGTYVRQPYEGGGRTSTYPFELWRYRMIPGVGEDVEIEFVDRSFSGEFKIALYPWEKDMLLNVDEMGETNSERLGMTKRYYRPGLHPGNINNTYYMTRYMGARMKDRPFERMRQYYALQRPPEIRQKELQTIVDTRVSYDTLPFTMDVYHLWVDDQSALLPITIEVPNRSLSYVERDRDYKARVGVYGRVTSMAGNVIGEFEHTVASILPKRVYTLALEQSSLFQEVVAVSEGRFKVEVVVKDLESGDLGVLVKSVNLRVPEPGSLSVSPIVLAEKLETLDSFPETPETFVMGDVKVVPRVNRSFKTSEDLGVYLQVYNPILDSSSLEPSVSIEYSIWEGDQLVEDSKDDEGESVQFFSPQRLVLVRELPLDKLDKGRYRLRVKVDDAISGQSTEVEADFEVSGE